MLYLPKCKVDHVTPCLKISTDSLSSTGYSLRFPNVAGKALLHDHSLPTNLQTPVQGAHMSHMRGNIQFCCTRPLPSSKIPCFLMPLHLWTHISSALIPILFWSPGRSRSNIITYVMLGPATTSRTGCLCHPGIINGSSPFYLSLHNPD